MKTALYFSLLTLWGSALFAQPALYIENGSLKVEESATGVATLHVNGDLKTNNGGITNSLGILKLKGDWEVNTFNYTSTGEFIFCGTGDQTVTNVAGANINIHDFTLDKPSGNVVLNSNVNVDGAINFMSSGSIETNNTELYLKNSDPNAILNATAPGNYSTVQKTIITKGTSGGLRRDVTKGSTYTYPVSNPVNYNPIQLEIGNTSTFSDATSDVLIRAEPWQDAFVDYDQFHEGMSCFPTGTWVKYNCFLESTVWRIEGTDNGDVHYKANAYPHTSGMTNNCGGNGELTSYRTLRSTTPNGNWNGHIENTLNGAEDFCFYQDASFFNELEGQGIPGGWYTSYSSMAVAGNGNGHALPVEMTFIRAQPVNNEFIAIDWGTATEINNSGFELQRSDDGFNFEKIAWIDGSGTTTDPVEYNYTDVDVVLNQNYYYRLKQIDFDGQFEYSDIVSARLEGFIALTVGELHPNPSSNYTKVEIMTEKPTEGEVYVFNASNSLVYRQVLNLTDERNIIKIPTYNISNGFYSVVFRIGEDRIKRKLIVAR